MVTLSVFIEFSDNRLQSRILLLLSERNSSVPINSVYAGPLSGYLYEFSLNFLMDCSGLLAGVSQLVTFGIQGLILWYGGTLIEDNSYNFRGNLPSTPSTHSVSRCDDGDIGNIHECDGIGTELSICTEHG